MRCRAIIADDEPIARRGLHAALLAERQIELVAMCRTGAEALDAIRTHRPDIALLDVAMPTLSGVDVVRALEPDERPAVIFVTAFNRFAIQAFELHAVDYLLKPFDQARFHTAVERARARMRDHTHGARLGDLADAFAARDPAATRIALKQGDGIVFVQADEIDYCEAADNYVRVHASGKEYLVRETMNAFERRLGVALFVRIHRSVIVNVSRVREARPHSHGGRQLLLRDGTRLLMSRTYREAAMLRVGASFG